MAQKPLLLQVQKTEETAIHLSALGVMNTDFLDGILPEEVKEGRMTTICFPKGKRLGQKCFINKKTNYIENEYPLQK